MVWVTKRCCLQKECTAPSWISIAKDSFQKELISFQVISLIPGEINLTVYLHLEATGSLPLTCTFKAGSVDLCTSPVAHFPSCSCNFLEKHLSSDRLKVTVTVNISDQIFTDSLTLRSCPNITENTQSDAQCTACVSAGCYWNNSGMKCTWTPKSAPYVHIQDICKQYSSEKNNMPEILALWPNEVSFHGKNNAVIKGKNLELVERIRFQGLWTAV
ncbi:plexin-C1-like [Ictalurus punctatus]|uniref:Plexin-C1-like n=1 Tax=Ictalurus punctatus TaxID=7998 RepID=A0A9F7TJB3_ICTPU|nr:plexin-C1-like [Ictalurus punctatus]